MQVKKLTLHNSFENFSTSDLSPLLAYAVILAVSQKFLYSTNFKSTQLLCSTQFYVEYLMKSLCAPR